MQMLFEVEFKSSSTNSIVIPDKVELGSVIDGKSVSTIFIATKISMPFTGNIEYTTKKKDVWIDNRNPTGDKFFNLVKTCQSAQVFPNSFDVSEADFSEFSKDQTSFVHGTYSPGMHKFEEKDPLAVEVVLKGFRIVGYERDKGGMLLQKDMPTLISESTKGIKGSQTVLLLLT